MRAMDTTARMTAAAGAVEGFSCADMGLLLDAVRASLFAIPDLLRISLSLISRRFAACPKGARFA